MESGIQFNSVGGESGDVWGEGVGEGSEVWESRFGDSFSEPGWEELDEGKGRGRR